VPTELTLGGGHPLAATHWSSEYLDSLYSQWKRDPSSLSESRQSFFQAFELGWRA